MAGVMAPPCCCVGLGPAARTHTLLADKNIFGVDVSLWTLPCPVNLDTLRSTYYLLLQIIYPLMFVYRESLFYYYLFNIAQLTVFDDLRDHPIPLVTVDLTECQVLLMY